MTLRADEFDPLEKLSLLAPHAVDLRHIPSAFQRLTPADVAGRLAKASRGASLLGRVMVAGELELMTELVIWLQVQIASTVIKPGSNKETPLIEPMSKLAIMEVVHPKVCRWCKGIGWLPELGQDGKETGKPQNCDGCRGGKYAYTERYRAKACDIHPEQWRRKYSRVYVEVLTIPVSWQSEAREALR